MSDVRPFEEYKEMIQDMSKEEMIKGLYDLSARVIKQENIIKEVREWANKTIFYFDFEEEITKHAFDLLYTKQGQELLEILDKAGDEK